MTWVQVHAVCFVVSYGAFLVAFVTGMLFLIQERQLKRKHMGWLFYRLPPLEILDRVNFMAIGVGFAWLSVGLVGGFWGAWRTLGRWWTGDPNEWLVMALWALYLGLWLVRARATVRGHRIAWVSVLGFSVVLVTFLGVSHVLPRWHVYV